MPEDTRHEVPARRGEGREVQDMLSWVLPEGDLVKGCLGNDRGWRCVRASSDSSRSFEPGPNFWRRQRSCATSIACLPLCVPRGRGIHFFFFFCRITVVLTLACCAPPTYAWSLSEVLEGIVFMPWSLLFSTTWSSSLVPKYAKNNVPASFVKKCWTRVANKTNHECIRSCNRVRILG